METVSTPYNYDWQVLVEEQQASGKNMKQFCLEKGIPYQSYKNHKRALENQSDKVSFIPVRTEKKNEISFKLNGNTLCFDASLDEAAISRIIKALAI